MPYLPHSAYRSPFWCHYGHVSTIYAGAIRQTRPPAYQRETWPTSDGDFLLVDYQLKSGTQAVILCHGLEGDSRSSYINTAANYFLANDYSVFSWNNRSCGGKMNRLPQLYHHASIEDLDDVVQEVLARGFTNVFLIGFSLGGAQVLNYFGRQEIDARVKAGVAVSTPIDLGASTRKIEHGFSKIYLNRFVKKIKAKVQIKATEFKRVINASAVDKARNLDDITECFIVPVHKFDSLDDYYHTVSPAYSMQTIKTPVLLLNALDDPILGKPAFPVEFAKKHAFVHLETPAHGGHCGFPLAKTEFAYAEIRALDFFKVWLR